MTAKKSGYVGHCLNGLGGLPTGDTPSETPMNVEHFWSDRKESLSQRELDGGSPMVLGRGNVCGIDRHTKLHECRGSCKRTVTLWAWPAHIWLNYTHMYLVHFNILGVTCTQTMAFCDVSQRLMTYCFIAFSTWTLFGLRYGIIDGIYSVNTTVRLLNPFLSILN